MTAALLDSEALPGVQVVLAWLTPLRTAATAHNVGDPLPFNLITQVAGHENPLYGTADLTIQVDTLCDRVLGYSAALAETRLTARRMGQLEVHLDRFTLADGTAISVDYVTVAESPRFMDYDDEQILRTMGRYDIGLNYGAAQ